MLITSNFYHRWILYFYPCFLFTETSQIAFENWIRKLNSRLTKGVARHEIECIGWNSAFHHRYFKKHVLTSLKVFWRIQRNFTRILSLEMKAKFLSILWIEYSNNMSRVKVLLKSWGNTLNIYGNTNELYIMYVGVLYIASRDLFHVPYDNQDGSCALT